jgi:hypothetical protein
MTSSVVPSSSWSEISSSAKLEVKMQGERSKRVIRAAPWRSLSARSSASRSSPVETRLEEAGVSLTA